MGRCIGGGGAAAVSPFGADAELHEGLDGRLYMLDLHRLFPCEAPPAAIMAEGAPPAAAPPIAPAAAYNVTLFRLFRPEFMAKYTRGGDGTRRISSDCFSGFAPEGKLGTSEWAALKR